MKRKLLYCVYGFILLTPVQAWAQSCAPDQRPCIVDQILSQAEQIDNTNWRDQTYREAAKTLASDGQIERAIGLISRIENPDTMAMTIRGIAMAVADLTLESEAQAQIFTTLHEHAKRMDHPPSFAIALTYIAMGQAFAGDNTGAWTTAKQMQNDALRNKAYGETAEIQAEMGKHDAAMTSIGAITSDAYRNKAHSIVSKILAERGDYQHALRAADKVTNPYKQAKALQFILNRQDHDETQRDAK